MEPTTARTNPRPPRRMALRRYGGLAALGVAALAVATLWLAAPAGWIRAQDGEAPDPALVEAGRTVFSLNCANEFCHGPRGGGNFMGEANAQKLTDNIWFRGDGSYEFIVKILNEGIPGTPMISWSNKLGEEKIRQVAAFVKTLGAGE